MVYDVSQSIRITDHYIFIAVCYRYRITWRKRDKLSTWAMAL